MIYFILSMVCFLLGGYLWGEARGTRATEKRWSEAVRRAAWPRRPFQGELPPSERRHWEQVDQPNGTCSACGAPLNAHMIGGYRLHPHLHRPLTEVHTQFRPGQVKGPNEDWMKS